MASRKHSLEWFKGLNKQEEDDLKKILDSNDILLDKLFEIVYNMVTSNEEISLSDYDNPSWSHKQAHINGQNHSLRKVLTFLKGKQDKS